MKALQTFVRNSLVTGCVILAFIETAWAQATQTPSAPGPAIPPTAVPDGGGGRGAVAFAVIVGLLAITGIAVKLYDLRRRREDEAVALQARLSDALLIEPLLAGVPVTPTVHVPYWGRSPAAVTLAGTVSRPELRDAAVQLVMREMSQARAHYRIEDHIAVDAMAARRAA
jgi:hypothetical protein